MGGLWKGYEGRMENDAQSYYKITFGLKVAKFAVLRIKYSQNNYVSVP